MISLTKTVIEKDATKMQLINHRCPLSRFTPAKIKIVEDSAK